ncbi:Deoxycytidine monophosphate (dCMP) deaminase [Coemansia sp. IMI 209128]|nr:Deoxycytidine monophosphate (dCMP) deaminase [Coemansia sp. IMI 209128]
MFISIIGPKASGKEEVANYLVTKLGFTRIYFVAGNLHSTATVNGNGVETDGEEQRVFTTAKHLINFITPRWRQNFVSTDITSPVDLYLMWKRPFVLVVGVDAPMGTRFKRYCAKAVNTGHGPLTLAQFVEMDDALLYRCEDPPTNVAALVAASDLEPQLTSETILSDSPMQPVAVPLPPQAVLLSPIIRNAADAHELNLKRVLSSANVTIANTFATIAELHKHLDHLDLLNPERLRPSWDTYFMLLSELASHRANCMKRKVGCILVKDNQIIATGYNGTPKGITNCNEGGCPRCNDGTPCGVSLDHCLCIHAEENALLEAGRGRVRNATGVVLYCNTCPCLGCAKKIVQVGVKVVVYSKGYGMDQLTLKLFKEANIVVRQHTPPTLSMEIGSP